MHGNLHALSLNITKVRPPRKPLRLSRDGGHAVLAPSRLAPVLNQNSQKAYIVVFVRGSINLQVRAAEDIVKSHRRAILCGKPLTSAFHYSLLRLPSPPPASGRCPAAPASPAHRRNLLSPFWRRIGIGAAFEQRAGGVYGGRPTTVIVADFRSP